MSLSNDILQYIAQQPENTWRDLTAAHIGGALGIDPDKTSKLLWSLEHTGRLELIRTGRSITGIARILRLDPAIQPRQTVEAPRTRRVDETSAPPSRTRTVKTPALDRYIEAKTHAARLNEEGSDYIVVQFKEDPLAEEGIMLRDRLSKIEAQYFNLSAEYRDIMREYDEAKSALRAKVTNSVAVAASGD